MKELRKEERAKKLQERDTFQQQIMLRDEMEAARESTQPQQDIPDMANMDEATKKQQVPPPPPHFFSDLH